MKKETFSQLSLEDLQTKVGEERTRLQKLRFGHAVTPLENPNVIRATRKVIARMMTAITQKQKAA